VRRGNHCHLVTVGMLQFLRISSGVPRKVPPIEWARYLLPRSFMPIRDHRDLIAWQLADELRRLIFELTERGPVSRDPRVREQIRDAISSVCRNLAEGFYGFDHPEFARYTRYSRTSLCETQDLILDGHHRKYWDDSTKGRLLSLAKRTMVAVSRLHRHLRSTSAPRPSGTQRT
jgi:four helix bundle protein